MADFKLDIDYPYSPPSRDILMEKPHKVPYCQREIKFRHYGHTMELMIRKAMELEDGNEKDILVSQLANHMKKSYLTWNRDSVEDEKILEDLSAMSKRLLNTSEVELADMKGAVTRQQYPVKQKMQRRNNPAKRH
jgi:hypothetical protein